MFVFSIITSFFFTSMMLTLSWLSHTWIRIQIFLLRFVSYVCFRYKQYRQGQFLSKPSFIEHIHLDHHSIRAVIYLPPSYSADVTITYPLHIDFHGGGFIFGRPEDDAEFCTYIAREVNCVVASLSYRLAPEYPFPAAVLDAKAGIDYLLSSKCKLNINRSKLSIGGFSAGGNLALAVSTLISNVSALTSFYPRTDFTIDHQAKTSPGPDITKFLIPLSRKAHLPPEIDLTNPLLSPVYANPETLPKNILIITAEYDTSCAEGEAFVNRMRDQGKQIKLWQADRCVHGWNFLDGSTYENKEKKWEAYTMCSKELNKAFYFL